MTNVFIVDRREIVRAGLCQILDAAPDISVVGVSSNPRAARGEIRESGADTVIIQPGADEEGVRLCRTLTRGSSRLRILMCHRPGVAHGALLLAGADEILDLEETGAALLERLRRKPCAAPTLEPDVTAALFDRVRSGAGFGDPMALLTDREVEILGLVSEGLTNPEIAARLHLSPKTVKNNVSTILKKLGMHTRTEAAVFAARRTDPAR